MVRRSGRRQARIPVDLEPSLLEYIEGVANTNRIPRTVLIRMMIKYCIPSLSEVIANGDPQMSTLKLPPLSDK